MVIDGHRAHRPGGGRAPAQPRLHHGADRPRSPGAQGPGAQEPERSRPSLCGGGQPRGVHGRAHARGAGGNVRPGRRPGALCRDGLDRRGGGAAPGAGGAARVRRQTGADHDAGHRPGPVVGLPLRAGRGRARAGGVAIACTPVGDRAVAGHGAGRRARRHGCGLGRRRGPPASRSVLRHRLSGRPGGIGPSSPGPGAERGVGADPGHRRRHRARRRAGAHVVADPSRPLPTPGPPRPGQCSYRPRPRGPPARSSPSRRLLPARTAPPHRPQRRRPGTARERRAQRGPGP